MKQANLFALRKQRQGFKREAVDASEANQVKIAKAPNFEAATIILADEKYGPETSLLYRWARLWFERNS